MVELIKLESTRKTYNGETVLDVDELSLNPGEVLAISGPNGAGKSTLLRMIGLLEPPDPGGGQFLVLGHRPDRRNRTELRRRMAIVFQAPYMFNRTVYENIAMGLKWRRRNSEIDERVRAASQLLEIDFFERRARDLSRGQAQRVALARAIALRPMVLLLDEPLNALDAGIRAKLLANLKKEATESGRAAIYVTHDDAEAELVADRSLTLIGGKVRRGD